MIKILEPNIQTLVHNICLEHSEVCKVADSNMGYLWHMYTYGSKAGQFRPFIFLAEINLLVKMGLIFQEEKDRLVEMLSSEDKDNMYLVGLSILQLRDQRIKTYGNYTEDNDAYKGIEYLTDVISPETFLVKT
jgi:hypothetical protein